MKKSKIRNTLIATLKMNGFKYYSSNEYWYELRSSNTYIVISIALKTTTSYKKHCVLISRKVKTIKTMFINKKSIINTLNILEGINHGL